MNDSPPPAAGRIRRLGPELVNQIAAGEVVERPASVIKELVENSIDAGASRIEVALEDGGKKLVRVSDDGIGMSATDLSLLFESHATSKIGGVDDLARIRTLGFRGEALASIAAVSRCRAVSRERGSAEASVVQCEAGRAGEVRSCGAPEGTLVEVRDLFFNTPARFKFLRSTATELRHIVEMMTRLALPHPALALALVHNGKPVLKLPGCAPPGAAGQAQAPQILAERLESLYGAEFVRRLLPVRSETSAMLLSGFVSPPGEGEASALQHFFLNGRAIRDRALQRAVAEAYRARLAHGRFPAVFLSLEIDPGRVDVNVHPTKIEVRFRDSGAVFAQVLTALEKALRAAAPTSAEPSKPPASAAERRENVRQAVTEFFDRSSGRRDFPPPGTGARTAASREPAPPAQPPQNAPPFEPPPAAPQAAPHPSPVAAQPPAPAPPRNFIQIHDRYLVEETPGGFLVADQHALHERILYEELKQRVSHAAVPRQRLLIPEIVDLRPADFLRVMEMRETLLKMGVEVEPFGEKTVAVHAVPHLATGANPRELLLEILRETAEESEGGAVDRQERLLRVIACKAAVKAGDRLSRTQVEALLDRRDQIGPETICPHGRPTTLRFDLRDIERQFLRK
ncbi:MAG: DNA mismatch repair endonuclease MutL [Candidatus Brocadiia bacterium]|jgi:DNA mismatch repair protein MutL